jgi:large subunit ribosomal protein L23
MSDIHQIIQRPIITERSTIEREERNIVTFEVDPRASKPQIKEAVEKLFAVSVLEVHTARVRGKNRRMGRSTGRKPLWKKARVRLAEGQSIEFFEGV